MKLVRTIRIALTGVAFVLAGCTQNMVRDMAASGMVSFGNKHIQPWFMSSTDTDIMCAIGEGMVPMTFPLGPKIDPMIPMVTLASGMCADERSKEEELRYIRAMRLNNVTEAQDARTMQKRWSDLAARRQYTGYQALVRYFGVPGGECPEFADQNEQMAYMFGLFGGFQALQADLANGGTAGVPLDTLHKAMGGLSCLNSDEFWGLPAAIQAMVQIMQAKVGDDRIELADGYAKLAAASALGEERGVRIVHMLEATLYSIQGDEEKTKDVIRKHVKTIRETPADPSLRLLDEMSTRGIRLISDKMWTQHTGQRTPFNQLGHFWDDSLKQSSSAPDIDDLL